MVHVNSSPAVWTQTLMKLHLWWGGSGKPSGLLAACRNGGKLTLHIMHPIRGVNDNLLPDNSGNEPAEERRRNGTFRGDAVPLR